MNTNTHTHSADSLHEKACPSIQKTYMQYAMDWQQQNKHILMDIIRCKYLRFGWLRAIWTIREQNRVHFIHKTNKYMHIMHVPRMVFNCGCIFDHFGVRVHCSNVSVEENGTEKKKTKIVRRRNTHTEHIQFKCRQTHNFSSAIFVHRSFYYFFVYPYNFLLFPYISCAKKKNGNEMEEGSARIYVDFCIVLPTALSCSTAYCIAM